MRESAEAVATGGVSVRTSIIDLAVERKISLRARYFYGVVFLLTNLSVWFLRDYAERFLPQLHYIKACRPNGYGCIHTLGVLRASLGCFLFFISMFLTTIKTEKLFQARNIWHSEWWGLKLLLLTVSMVIPFLIPSDYIHLYGEVARIGAGIFLILQLVSVIHFIAWWNKYWMPGAVKKPSGIVGLFMSTLFYAASICGIGLMYLIYAPRSSCVLNIFFITWTAVLLIVMLAVSLHSKVNRGLLSSGIMASYVVFLCWSALRSEPATGDCNKGNQVSQHTDWTTTFGFLIAICAVVMATFSTGIDSQSFQFRRDEAKEDDDVPYNYGFFHMVFSLGAMYFAMLFVSWNLNYTENRKWSIDVGWASTWVKIINEWFAASLYIWMLISPIVRQTKVTDLGESMQRTQNTSEP